MIEILSRKASESTVFPEDSMITTFLNPYSYVLARKNRQLFDKFDRIYFDGIALSLFYRLTGNRIQRRSFDMTSLAPIIFSLSEEEEKSIYLVGTEQQHLENAVKKIRYSYPGIRVAGMHHGYFADEEMRESCLQQIVGLQPDIVIVGMGAILQEKFLIDLCSRDWKGLGFTCGGFFHQTAKSGVKYYPGWIDKLNLRWIYRIYDEPNLIKRYLFKYPIFAILFIKDLGTYILNKNATLNR